MTTTSMLIGALWIVGCGWFLIRYYNINLGGIIRSWADQLFNWSNNRPGVIGHYISAREMLYIWPTTSVLFGFLATGLIFLLISILAAIWLGFEFMGSWWFWAIYVTLSLSLAIYVGWPTKGTALQVPNNTVAPLLILGELRRIYLEEGEYPWWPQALNDRLFFGFNVFDRSRIAHRDFTTRKKDKDTEDGFVKIGTALGSTVRIPFTLYNSAADVNGAKNVMIKGVAKTGAPIKTEFLITLEVIDPYPLLRNQDPGLEIAERGRSAVRTGQAQLTSKDNAVAKDCLAHLAVGETVLFAFMNDAIGNLQAGSIVRDLGGEPKYWVVKPKEGESDQAALERTKTEYIAYLDKFISDEMRKTVTSATGEYIIEERTIKADLAAVISINGARLVSASVGTVITDERLAEAAVQAEQQSFEGATAVASARAARAAREVMAPTAEEMADPTFLDRQVLGAAMDPGNTNIRYQHVSGSGASIIKAATILRHGGAGTEKKDT